MIPVITPSRGRPALAALFALIAGACATVDDPPQRSEAPVSRGEQQQAQQAAVRQMSEKRLKQKIAVGRFTNETRYGRTLLRDEDLDPLGKQASDIMSTYLEQSGAFLVFERPDLVEIEREQARTGTANTIGVDTLVLGSVTEFGRTVEGETGFLSGTKVQIARAKVAVRLVDTRTGLVFHSATGTGQASTESGTVAGFGSRAEYDATLNDRAISAAIGDVIGGLMDTLEEREWRTDILKVDGDRLFLSGGERQGLEVGDRLAVYRQGEVVKSQQTGFEITLPGQRIAAIEVVSLFGESEANEGSVARIVSGSVPADETGDLYVTTAEEMS